MRAQVTTEELFNNTRVFRCYATCCGRTKVKSYFPKSGGSGKTIGASLIELFFKNSFVVLQQADF